MFFCSVCDGAASNRGAKVWMAEMAAVSGLGRSISLQLFQALKYILALTITLHLQMRGFHFPQPAMKGSAMLLMVQCMSTGAWMYWGLSRHGLGNAHPSS